MILGILTILAGFMLFVGQRWLFSTGAWGLIQIATISRQEYTNDYFTPAALVVLIVSTICAISWYVISSRWSVNFAPIKEMKAARVMWISLSIPPVLSLVVAVLLYGGVSAPALPWMFLFLLLNLLVVYWLSTVLSTPEEMVAAVFAANWLRLR